MDKIILLKENLPEPTLTTGVVLKIELIKAMKSTLVCMNIQKVNIQIIPVQTNAKVRSQTVSKYINKFINKYL